MNNIHALISQCGLGTIEGEIIPVSGGFMHKMYKVHTTSGTYAVKCLNPEIMSRPGVMDNYSEAERLEQILKDNGLPVVTALSIGDKKMMQVNGRYYYIFPWQAGTITDFSNISEEQCFTAGTLLGKMHAIDARNTEAAEPEMSNVDFASLLDCAVEKESIIAPILEENIKLLEDAQKSLNEARNNLPSMSAICDDDMDPKNIMWHEGNAYIIDLECLEYGNPISSCLNLALQWCGTVTGKYSRENLEAFFKGYLQSYDNGFRSYDELFGIAYTWVEWLEYNIKRALGIVSSDAEEIKIGEAETLNTVNRIKYLSSIEKDICSALRNLPNPDSKNYKTHDDSICYIDLVFEGELNNIKCYELPKGYRFVPYIKGDKDTWIDIELSAEEIQNREQGEECWQRYYKNVESELPHRMYFIEDETGNKVATATALYDIHGNAKTDEGQLHWVAIKKEAQGKGLSKPLITYVLEVMKELGYTRVKVHTQTNTWLACKVYSDLNFQPEAESISKNRAGWKMIELLTGRNLVMKTIEILGENRFETYTKTRIGCRAVIIRDNKILLSHETISGWWLVPGGGLEEGETPEDCVIREVEEETGFIVKPIYQFLILNEYYEEYCYTSHYFVCEVIGEGHMHLTEAEEKRGLRPEWLPLADALEMYSEHESLRDISEEKRGSYQREYTALLEYMNCLTEMSGSN